jgi:EmrB/QacA subfamily drug resistance transporter
MAHAAPGHDADRQHYGITFAVLAIAGASFSLLQSIVSPALRDIQVELDTSTGTVAWIMTGYFLSASVAIPIFGRLGDMFGKKRMLVASLVALAAGLVISAIGDSIGLVIAGRIVQGLGGAVFPLSFGIIRDEFPRERIHSGIAMISALLGIGGGLGIVLAGPIVESLSFHWLFWMPLITVLVALVGLVLFVPESPIRARGKVDVVGAVLLSLWLLALLLAVTEGEQWGWGSGRIVGLFVVAAVLLVVWVAVENRVAAPLVDMRMMRLRTVWTTNLAAFLFGFGMIGSFVLVPQLVQMPESTGYGFGASITEAGFFLVPSTAAMLLFSPLSGRLSATVGSRVPLLIGAAFGTASFLFLALAHGEPWMIYLATALMGGGLGFAWASMANLIVGAVPPEQTGIATGMNTIMRTVGGAIGGQIVAVVLDASVLRSTGLPREHGFTIGFLIAAAGLAVTFLAALLVPRAATRPAAATPARTAPAATE